MQIKDFQVFDNDIDLETLNYYLKCDAIAVDTETMGLIPRRDRLCLVQICDQSDRVSLVRIGQGIKSAPHLKLLFEASEVVKVFHFARFDVGMLESHLGIATHPIFCTKIASKLARTYTGKHGLKELVKELEQIELDKEAQSSDWGNVHALSEQQLKYAANDVRYLLSVYKKLIDMLIREHRYDLAKACFAHIPTLVYLDLLGYDDIFAH
ncbi:ribonuclease D [Tumidithrix elongata RA019]|uniref:Ribonuclease D n=1 Tax=Tumidithrix elongata BACA0141 TaxID=2716417 RepID=A0AAW9Q5I3_9CYAN|nr:ribonuclease D [Tumidithrix elongata RA019]